jgi:hypothetical protein
MAIAIKTIPLLQQQAALAFEERANKNFTEKSKIDFSKEISIAKKILEKAKLK